MDQIEKAIKKMKTKQREYDLALKRNADIKSYGEDFAQRLNATGILEQDFFKNNLKDFCLALYRNIHLDYKYLCPYHLKATYFPEEEYQPMLGLIDDNNDLFFDMFYNFARYEYGRLIVDEGLGYSKAFNKSKVGIGKLVNRCVDLTSMDDDKESSPFADPSMSPFVDTDVHLSVWRYDVKIFMDFEESRSVWKYGVRMNAWIDFVRDTPDFSHKVEYSKSFSHYHPRLERDEIDPYYFSDWGQSSSGGKYK